MSLSDLDMKPNNLLERVEKLERQSEEMERWAMPIGSVARIAPPAAYIGRSAAPWAIANNAYTVVTAMTDTQFADGLLIDTVNGEWIEFVRNRDGEYYHICVNAKWASNSVGFREVTMQLYDSDAGTWGTSLQLDIRNANAVVETVQPGYFLYRLVDLKFSRVRFQVKQDSGGNLNLIYFLAVVAAARLP